MFVILLMPYLKVERPKALSIPNPPDLVNDYLDLVPAESPEPEHKDLEVKKCEIKNPFYFFLIHSLLMVIFIHTCMCFRIIRQEVVVQIQKRELQNNQIKFRRNS